MKWNLIILMLPAAGCKILNVIDPNIVRSFDPTIARGFESNIKTRQLRTEMAMGPIHSNRYYKMDKWSLYSKFGHDYWRHVTYWDGKTQKWRGYKSHTQYLNR